MLQYVALFYGVFRRDVTMLRRYPVETLSYFALYFMYFVVIFYGGKAVAGPTIGESLSSIVVGFFLWTLTLTTFVFLANRIHREAQWGTLEQLYLSPYRFTTVMLAAVFSSALTSAVVATSNLGLMLLLTQEKIAVDLVTIVPILVLTLLSAVGFGFVFAGLALIYKRIRSLLQMIQFLFVGFISAPYYDIPLFSLLPVTQGSGMLQRAMIDGIRLWEFSPLELGTLLAVPFGHALIGYTVFYVAQHRARQQGRLDEY